MMRRALAASTIARLRGLGGALALLGVAGVAPMGVSGAIARQPQPTSIAPVPSDPRIDAKGRPVATWRLDQPLDITRSIIELDIPDAMAPRARGVVTHTARVVAAGVEEFVFQCRRPSVREVTVNGAPAWFEQRSGVGGVPGMLRIVPARDGVRTALPQGTELTIRIGYDLDFGPGTDEGGPGRGDGLTWSAPLSEPTGPSDAAPVIHAQGQAEWSSDWFPCLDTPAERMASEVIVTVDEGLEVVSNGLLHSRTPAAPGARGQPRETWHWKQDKEHAPYLVTLAIGEFAIVDVNFEGSARPGVPMPVYVPVGSEARAREVFFDTPRMMAFFERTFDEPFPWDKYAQVLVRGFVWGGMENTSATFLRPGILDDAGSAATISHELAHSWFGNLLTCRHWDHAWLNEGFATFAEALWSHEDTRTSPGIAGGENAAAIAYENKVRSWLRSELRGRGASLDASVALVAPADPAMINTRYKGDADAPFEQADNPYTKGALLLHMLREQLGEQTFWEGVRVYIDRFRNKSVETDDLRFVLEEVSGLSLDRFFEQWAHRPGLPRLRVSSAWDAASSALVIDVEQLQTIDRLNPAYVLDVPLTVVTEGVSDSPDAYATQVATHRVRIEARQTRVSIPMVMRPTRVRLDPALTLAASINPREVDLATGELVAEDLGPRPMPQGQEVETPAPELPSPLPPPMASTPVVMPTPQPVQSQRNVDD